MMNSMPKASKSMYSMLGLSNLRIHTKSDRVDQHMDVIPHMKPYVYYEDAAFEIL
jgi:hypothetical protein